jgi:Zn-dependent metalloprotease
MKKITKYITENIRPPLLAMLILFIGSNVIGQGEQPLSEKFRNIAKPGSTKEWITFWQDSTIKPQSIFTDFKDAFGLSQNDEMTIVNTKKDDLGFVNYKYQQYYKNHPVLYGEYIVHQQPDGIVKSANGRLITGLNAGGNASITEKQALNAALRFMNAGKYLWQNAAMEKELKRQQKNEQATYYPKGELIYAPRKFDGKFDPSDYRLAWSFKIYTDQSDVRAKNVYVDAVTGNVVYANDIAMVCSTGSGTSAYNGSVSVSTQLSGGIFQSHNDCQATDIYVYNCNRGSASNTFYTDADNSWTATSQQSAVQAQWGAAQTYSYYLGDVGRTSWDNSGSDMIAYNNSNQPGLGVNNSCWGCTGNNVILGAGNTTAATDDWNTDDIMGHEFTHGVTQASANLTYSNESGALNESFSDIFGEMVESWSEGNCDYLVGADMTEGPIRSFINPKSFGDPDTYLGTNWYTGTADNGGVHTNSSVQNHWFYLLSEGGSGTNDRGESYNVTGITRFKARLIAYRALTVYLTSSSQYIDARKAMLEAAWDLYGQCSQEIISVGDAWHAVGVESQSPVYTINACGSYPANGTFIQAISTLTAANGCSTTITPGSTTVYFTARDKVILFPGFTAQNGSNFTAYLEPCSSTRWLTNPQPPMSDAEKGIVTSIASKNQSAATKEILNANESVSVAPNPFGGSFMLSINSNKEQKAQVIIYNAVGVKVKEQSDINLSKGINKIPFNCPNFASGVYSIEINLPGSKVVRKIVKGQ